MRDGGARLPPRSIADSDERIPSTAHASHDERGTPSVPEPVPMPFLDADGVLHIPFESDAKYHWWAGGQEIYDTLRELGAGDDVIRRYTWRLDGWAHRN